MTTHRAALTGAFVGDALASFRLLTVLAGCEAPSFASAGSPADSGASGSGAIDPAGTDGGDDQYNTVIDEPTDEQYDD